MDVNARACRGSIGTYLCMRVGREREGIPKDAMGPPKSSPATTALLH